MTDRNGAFQAGSGQPISGTTSIGGISFPSYSTDVSNNNYLDWATENNAAYKAAMDAVNNPGDGDIWNDNWLTEAVHDVGYGAWRLGNATNPIKNIAGGIQGGIEGFQKEGLSGVGSGIVSGVKDSSNHDVFGNTLYDKDDPYGMFYDAAQVGSVFLPVGRIGGAVVKTAAKPVLGAAKPVLSGVGKVLGEDVALGRISTTAARKIGEHQAGAIEAKLAKDAAARNLAAQKAAQKTTTAGVSGTGSSTPTAIGKATTYIGKKLATPALAVSMLGGPNTVGHLVGNDVVAAMVKGADDVAVGAVKSTADDPLKSSIDDIVKDKATKDVVKDEVKDTADNVVKVKKDTSSINPADTVVNPAYHATYDQDQQQQQQQQQTAATGGTTEESVTPKPKPKIRTPKYTPDAASPELKGENLDVPYTY